MERVEIYIILVVVGAVVGLIVTADNEPPQYVGEDKKDKPHLVDRVPPERSTHNVTVIKNPDAILR